MALVQDLQVTGSPVSAEATAMIKLLVARAFWAWYAQNSAHTFLTIKVLFIKKKIRARDLESVFEWLFGPRPVIDSLPNLTT